MFKHQHSSLQALQHAMQIVSQGVIVGCAIVLVLTSGAAAFGVLPWPEMSLRLGAEYIPNAGIYGQLGLTLLMVMLCFFLPANTRMSRLEKSHRSFQISMEDVRRAYEVVHNADRRSVFTLSSEFDDMRKRLEYLRKHPDLTHLEPELLVVAAEMSQQSRDIARIYSVKNVDRAKDFLRHRQEEVTQMQERLKLARSTCDDLRRWLSDIEAGERDNSKGLRALELDLRDILPTLGFDFQDMRKANIVAMPKQMAKPSPDPKNQ